MVEDMDSTSGPTLMLPPYTIAGEDFSQLNPGGPYEKYAVKLGNSAFGYLQPDQN